MKRLFLYILFLVVAGGVIAQPGKQYAVPEFAKIPAENRYDSIYEWYRHAIFNPYPAEATKNRAEKSHLMNEAMAYANRSGDLITRVCMKFYLGHFYENAKIDSAKGMSYMFEAIDMAKQRGLEYEWAAFLGDFGIRFYATDPAKGLEYMLRADEVIRRLGVSHKIWCLERSYILGTVFFHHRNYTACIQTLGPAIEGFGTNVSRIQVNNTMGLAYRETGNNDSAIFYFRKVLALAQQPPYYGAWVGIVAGNIGSVYFAQHQLDSALIYARLNYDLLKDNPEISRVGVAEPLVLIASIYMEKQQTDAALSYLLQAEKLIAGKQLYHSPNTGRLMLKVCTMLAKISYEKQNYGAAGQYSQKALALQKELSLKDNEEAYTRVQEQLEAEKNISSMKETENAIRLSVQRRNFFITVLCFTGLILFTLYRRQRFRNRKNRELFDSREQLLFAEKKHAEENLVGYVENLQEKNRIIEDLEQEIELLDGKNDDNEKQEVYDALNNLKRSTIITSDDWVRFKLLFEEVHLDFFEKLAEKFPDITQAEMRMLALMKLDIPDRKMANMLGISPDSIRKTRYRFIKKINFEGGTSDLIKIVDSL